MTEALDVGGGSEGPVFASDVARRAAALERWRERSRQVRFFRKALPAAIIAILVFGLGWVGIRALISSFAGGERRIGVLRMVEPVFYGRNDKGQAYQMSAAEAVRDGAEPNRIALTRPYLSQQTGAPLPMTAQGAHGAYLEKEKLLDLIGEVVATDGQGYRFTSGFAHIDLRAGTVSGRSAVQGAGPSGTIRADAYNVYDKGQHILFTGHVMTRLYSAATRNALGQAAKSQAAKSQAPAPPALGGGLAGPPAAHR